MESIRIINFCRLTQKQLAYMLGSQQIFLELNDDIEEYDDLVEIMSNAHLNNNFLALAREVCSITVHFLVPNLHRIPKLKVSFKFLV